MRDFHPNAQMSLAGMVMAVLLLVVTLPLLPFVVVGWAIVKLLGGQGDQVSQSGEPTREDAESPERESTPPASA
jgi:hypothetical protein